MSAWRILVLAVLLLTPVSAWAQPKNTDVISLANGDRITGEIEGLYRGRLELTTDDAGTIFIEWDNIVRITSVREFEVEMMDGRRLVGSLVSVTDRYVAVGTAGGVIPLPMFEMTRISPIGRSFWSKLEGSIDAGFSYTRSSGVAQVNVNGTVVFRRPAFLFRLSGSATVTEQSDESLADDRAATEFGYERFRGRSWFIAAATRFESNESLGLALRSQIGGVIGWRLVNTNRSHVQFGAGLVGNDEQGIEAEATQNFEGLVKFTASYYWYDRPKANADVAVQYYPSLSNWGRQRLQFDTNLRREFWKDLTAAFNVFFTFDSAPPNPSAARSDLGITLSLGWTF